MRILATLPVLALLLAGCSGSSGTSSIDCPDDLPEGYEEQYNEARNELAKDDIEIPDRDGDCVPDATEMALGTDPDDADDYPDFEDPEVYGQLLNATMPRYYEWQEETFTGSYTTTILVDVGSASEARDFTVPSKAERAWFNITFSPTVPFDGGVRFIHEDCSSTECYKEGDRNNNVLTLEVLDPDAGNWRVVVFTDGGADQGTYELVVNSRVQVDPPQAEA